MHSDNVFTGEEEEHWKEVQQIIWHYSLGTAHITSVAEVYEYIWQHSTVHKAMNTSHYERNQLKMRRLLQETRLTDNVYIKMFHFK